MANTRRKLYTPAKTNLFPFAIPQKRKEDSSAQRAVLSPPTAPFPFNYKKNSKVIYCFFEGDSSAQRAVLSPPTPFVQLQKNVTKPLSGSCYIHFTTFLNCLSIHISCTVILCTLNWKQYAHICIFCHFCISN